MDLPLPVRQIALGPKRALRRPAPGTDMSKQEQIDDVKTALDTLGNDVKALHALVTSVSQQGSTNERAVQGMGTELQGIHNDTKQLLTGAAPVIQHLDKDVTDMRKEIGDTRKEIGENSLGKWAKGSIIGLMAVGVTVLLTCLGYIISISSTASRLDTSDKNRGEQITALNTATGNLTAATTKLQTTVSLLDNSVGQLTRENQNLADRLKTHGDKLDKLDKEIAGAVAQAKLAAVSQPVREQTARLYLAKENIGERGNTSVDFRGTLPNPIPEQFAGNAKVAAKLILPAVMKIPADIQAIAELSKDGRSCIIHVSFRGPGFNVDDLFRASASGTLPIDLTITYPEK
jgi:uncharacterized protein YlxW (UPF0749 family)